MLRELAIGQPAPVDAHAANVLDERALAATMRDPSP
jgi:hypothetical protein